MSESSELTNDAAVGGSLGDNEQQPRGALKRPRDEDSGSDSETNNNNDDDTINGINDNNDNVTNHAESSPSAETSSLPAALSLGARLLAKSGYKGSGGLGRREQGITDALPESSQISQHGLGYQSQFKRQKHEFSEVTVSIEIVPRWLATDGDTDADSPIHRYSVVDFHAHWLQESAHDDNLLCSPLYASLDSQHRVQECKSMFDEIDAKSFKQARDRSNPFEQLKGEFFQNRAALKMAELDRICHRIFSQPQHYRAVKDKRNFYFGDICAGPGGFSEYLLTKHKWRAKGFGFTLRGPLDFNLSKFNSNAPTQSFRAYYGVDDSGDITNNDNMVSFNASIRAETEGVGLDTLMADGGFDVVGEENKQELRSQQLLLCQLLTGLLTLSDSGSMVCKTFDCYLPFNISLLYVVSQCFKQFSIVKPNQSRPANSERYIVCDRLKQDFNRSIVDYLLYVNQRINELRSVKNDDGTVNAVVSLVPHAVIERNERFYRYVREMNESLAQKQIQSLQRIRAYIEDPNLPSDSQQAIRRQCLAYWELTSVNDNEWDGVKGFVHFDSRWSVSLINQHYQQGIFSSEAGVQLFDDILSQLECCRVLTALPTVDEIKYLSAVTAKSSSGSSGNSLSLLSAPLKQYQSLSSVTEDYYLVPVPLHSVHSFLFANSHNQLFLADDRRTMMRLPTSFFPALRLPANTVLECFVGSQSVMVLDAWCLPCDQSTDPDSDSECASGLVYQGVQSSFTGRRQQLTLLLDAMRLTADTSTNSSVRLASAHSLDNLTNDELAMIEDNIGDELLVVANASPRPSTFYRWCRTAARNLSANDVMEVLGGLVEERERVRLAVADRGNAAVHLL